jgi:hypothetical protein
MKSPPSAAKAGHERDTLARLKSCLPATADQVVPSRARKLRFFGELLGSGAFGEAGDGSGFGVVDVEDGEQLGDLQDFLELAAQVTEAE